MSIEEILSLEEQGQVFEEALRNHPDWSARRELSFVERKEAAAQLTDAMGGRSLEELQGVVEMKVWEVGQAEEAIKLTDERYAQVLEGLYQEMGSLNKEMEDLLRRSESEVSVDVVEDRLKQVWGQIDHLESVGLETYQAELDLYEVRDKIRGIEEDIRQLPLSGDVDGLRKRMQDEQRRLIESRASLYKDPESAAATMKNHLFDEVVEGLEKNPGAFGELVGEGAADSARLLPAELVEQQRMKDALLESVESLVEWSHWKEIEFEGMGAAGHQPTFRLVHPGTRKDVTYFRGWKDPIAGIENTEWPEERFRQALDRFMDASRSEGAGSEASIQAAQEVRRSLILDPLDEIGTRVGLREAEWNAAEEALRLNNRKYAGIMRGFHERETTIRAELHGLHSGGNLQKMELAQNEAVDRYVASASVHFKDPAQASDAIERVIREEGFEDVAARMRNRPQTFGELKGSTTFIGLDDGERKAAKAALAEPSPHAVEHRLISQDTPRAERLTDQWLEVHHEKKLYTGMPVGNGKEELSRSLRRFESAMARHGQTSPQALQAAKAVERLLGKQAEGAAAAAASLAGPEAAAARKALAVAARLARVPRVPMAQQVSEGLEM